MPDSLVITVVGQPTVTLTPPAAPTLTLQTPGIQGPKGDKGDTGNAGTAGADGVDGAKILVGTTDPPSDTLGNNGDFYIDNNHWFARGPKAAGTWVGAPVVSMIGPPGANGTNGTGGGGGGGSAIRYLFDAGNDGSGAGSGYFELDIDTISSVTEIYLSPDTNDVSDISPLIQKLTTGSVVQLWNADYSWVQFFLVSAAPTNPSGPWEVVVTLINSNNNGMPAQDELIYFTFTP